jgi:hypothetical protein
MRFPLTATYPFLLTAIRVLYLAANNPGEFVMGDLMATLGWCLLGTAVVYALLAALLWNRATRQLPALITLIFVAWVFGASALGPAPWDPPPIWLTAVGLLLCGLLIAGFASRPAALRLASTYLTYTYAFLTLWLVGDLAIDWYRERQQLARSSVAAALARPIAVHQPARVPKRNIYVIVLDEYANHDVLREVEEFDNRPFEDSLRVLGFHVPALVRSNYAHTHLSIASLLNAAHLYSIERELPVGSTDRTLSNYLLAHGRVSRFLQGMGYRFIFFPSSWYNSTRDSPIADSVVRVGPRFSVGRALSQTEFRRVIWQNTPLAWIYREAEGDPEMVQETLEGLAYLPRERGPVFAFAHVMNPHRPYVFYGPACQRRPAGWHREVPMYVAQLQCVNTLVLRTVTRILHDSAVPPIIVLQGDHGTSFLGFNGPPTADQVSEEAATERFGAFGAYYLPEGGAAAFGDTVSVVNVLGNILRYYFGAELPVQSNERYMSNERVPFAFVPMEDRELGRLRKPDPSTLDVAPTPASFR